MEKMGMKKNARNKDVEIMENYDNMSFDKNGPKNGGRLVLTGILE